jgi:two-component system chemotaxis sensor kinase CheA
MSNQNHTSPEQLLNSILSSYPLVCKDDLSILSSVMDGLEKLSSISELPSAIKAITARAIELSNSMIFGDVDFERGLKVLGESLERLKKGIESLDLNVDSKEGTNPEVQEFDDIVKKFTGQMRDTLDQFEKLCLDFDKGKNESLDGIKRTIHTWKGEFGILELKEYSKLMHRIEDSLFSNTLSADGLLYLKDFLDSKLESNSLCKDLNNDEFSVALDRIIVAKRTGNQTSRLAGDTNLLREFVSEAKDHLHSAETGVLDLEEDPGNKEHLNKVFRSFHTIKGLAGFLNLAEIVKLAHITENLLDAARKDELRINESQFDLILASTDCLTKIITNIEKALPEGEYEIPEESADIFQAISSVMTGVKTETKKIGEILIEEGKATVEQVLSALDQQRSGDKRKVGEILVEKEAVTPKEIDSALRQQVESKRSENDETIKVPVSKLDLLIDTVGEAVIAQSMLSADPSIKDMKSSQFQAQMTRMSLIVRQVQELSMSLRMVTIKPTFQKMARLVRDLSKKTGKDVELVTEGEDTELDKSIVEKVADPLIHMVRNSIDHGIETPQERTANGKAPKSHVILRAYHKGGNIAIEVEDDGKGLDKEKIMAKAVEKGLVRSSDHLTDQEIFQFIFLPGFSTSAKVTDISGRGVGMDVVRQNIEALRGVVDIDSEKDKGSRFTMRLPLTLAIIDGMAVKRFDETYIIPTASVVESIAVTEEKMSSILQNPFLMVREETIPLRPLDQALSGSQNQIGSMNYAVIVEDAAGKKMALGVDAILGQQQVVIKSIANGLENVPGISGAAIMSDGSVSLIIDITGLRKTLNISVDSQQKEAL